ncbi:hypothetical protein [Actinokineospora sp. NPDC004072]
MTERCDRCGRSRDDVDPLDRLAWVRDTDERGSRWHCPRCAREHLRSIEAKLSAEWW